MEISQASGKMKERQGPREGSLLAFPLKKIPAAGFLLLQRSRVISSAFAALEESSLISWWPVFPFNSAHDICRLVADAKGKVVPIWGLWRGTGQKFRAGGLGGKCPGTIETNLEEKILTISFSSARQAEGRMTRPMNSIPMVTEDHPLRC